VKLGDNNEYYGKQQRSGISLFPAKSLFKIEREEDDEELERRTRHAYPGSF
jgi:hypothetical protein